MRWSSIARHRARKPTRRPTNRLTGRERYDLIQAHWVIPNAPVAALVDGNYRFNLPCPIQTVIKGDSLSLSIAAASILAKTARDRLMIELDAQYPEYGFARHKGYNAPIHHNALQTLGPCPAHRRTWAPIRTLLNAEG